MPQPKAHIVMLQEATPREIQQRKAQRLVISGFITQLQKTITSLDRSLGGFHDVDTMRYQIGYLQKSIVNTLKRLKAK